MSKSHAMKVAIFASGNGSNFEAIVESVKAGKVEAEIVLLVCDRPDACVLDRAQRLGVSAITCHPQDFESKKAYEKEVLEHLYAGSVELIILAGYMRIVGQTLLAAYTNKIMNIHPSLLPLYPGRHGIQDALEDGATETGVTVHLVDEGIDTGPILAQRKIPIEAGDTLESLESKIHAIEHDVFPEAIQMYIEKLKKENTQYETRTD